MTIRIDPHTGDVLAGGGGVGTSNLTADQRNLAVFRDADADSILHAIDIGLATYFTAFALRSKRDKLDELAAAGILTKHESTQHAGSFYYKPTAITRNWCLTAIALRQERCRLLAERAR